MKQTFNSILLNRLIVAVERRAGFKPTSPSGFAILADMIKVCSGGIETVSVSTLKRIWGYVTSEHIPSDVILSILSRYCGYRDWAHFTESDIPDSGFLVSSSIAASSITVGMCVELRWAPDREVRLRYLGEELFEVVQSVNAKIIVGDRLRALVFCQGYPFYATDIRRGKLVIPSYIAAKKGGLLCVNVTKAD